MKELIINSELSLYFTKKFPTQKNTPSSKKYLATVGFGGNVGDSIEVFHKLFNFFDNSIKVDIIKTSPILKNPPFGFLNQNDFYNGVIILKTNLSPRAFLKFLLHTENKFGRVREFKNSPRTLDLDIILFDRLKVNSKDLKIPHPCWRERDSVIIPLSYIN